MDYSLPIELFSKCPPIDLNLLDDNFENKCIINDPSQYFNTLPESEPDYVCLGKYMKPSNSSNSKMKSWCAMKK